MKGIIVLTKNQVKKIVSNTIEETLSSSMEKKIQRVQKEWLTNKEGCEWLSMTPRTMQNYRDKGVIPFSKVGTKIYYKTIDLNAFLESNYLTGFNKKGGRYDK